MEKSRKFLNRPRVVENSFKQIKPVFQIIGIFGAFPAYAANGSRGIEPSGIFHYLWAAMCLGLLTVALAVQIVSVEFVAEKNGGIRQLWKNLSTATFLLKEFLFYAAMLLDYLNFFCRQRETRLLFEGLERFDSEARRVGYPRRQSVLAYWIAAFVCVSSSFGLASVAATTTGLKSVAKLASVLVEIINSHLILKWILCAYMIKQRFEHLNGEMVRNMSDIRRRPTMTQSLMQFHANLIQVVKIYNNLAAFVLLPAVTALLVNLIVHVENLMRQRTLLVELLILNSVVQIYSLCHVCNATANEANDTGRCITDFHGILADSRDLDERMNLAIQLFHSRVEFSAGDVFDVNLLTFRSMVVVFFTFVVVMAGIDEAN